MFVLSAKEVLIKPKLNRLGLISASLRIFAESEGEDAADPPHVFCGNAAP